MALTDRFKHATRASLLSQYGLDLPDARERMTPSDLAGLIVNLPMGSPLWVATGGSAAWSQETAALLLVEHRVRLLIWAMAGDGGKQPEPIEAPPTVFEEERKQAREQDRAARYLERVRAKRQRR